MYRSSRIRVAFGLVCSLLVLGFAASARADETYFYTGTPFTNFSAPYSCSGGVGECALSGWVTLAQALPVSSTTSVQFPAVPGYADVVSWRFTDGNFVWTPSDSTPDSFLATFTTNSSGQIIQWTLNGGTATVGSNTYQWYSNNTGCAILKCGDSSTENSTIFAKNTAPGSWTMAATSRVPEPSSMLLLMVGIASLAIVRRRSLA